VEEDPSEAYPLNINCTSQAEPSPHCRDAPTMMPVDPELAAVITAVNKAFDHEVTGL
jgi:hypothetical protein